MRINLKSILSWISLAFNVFIICILIITAMSDNISVFFPAPKDGYMAAATVAQFPVSSALVFSPLEFTLKPREKAVLQYSVFVAKKQNNILINALYDPAIIAVTQTGSGIEITALREGETLMQTITSDGIKNIALITVTE